MMFDNLYIPWTSRLGYRNPQPEPEPAVPTTTTTTPPKICNRTLHIARALIAHAAQPFPEFGRAIAAAVHAYIRGEITIDLAGDPSTWIAVAHTIP